MRTSTGLDVLRQKDFEPLKGKAIGLVCNQASVSHDYRHILELLLPLHQRGELQLKAVFGPQHGLYGHTQDNMIEWETGDRLSLPVPLYSLYGQHREPTQEMLEGIELLVIDLQDVGARYYTFVWTTALCLKACGERDIPVMVLDRPNPIGGTAVEGTVGDPVYASFVGLHPLPIRHGLTLAEIASYLQRGFYPDAELQSVLMTDWDRKLYLDQTGAPWSMPSPNMPTVDTAVVYPGGCFIEGTNLSEGRGTTRPFEIVGAPYLDGWAYASALNDLGLPGCRFRPLQFEPTFNKHARTLCEGVFLHVLDRASFDSVLAFVAIMQEARRQAGDKFEWKAPPYEYEYIKLPIDILAGNVWLREAIDALTPLSEIRSRFQDESGAFAYLRHDALLYRAPSF